METKVSWIYQNDSDGKRSIRDRVLLAGWTGATALLYALCAFYFVLPGASLGAMWSLAAVLMGVVFVLNFFKLKETVEKERVLEAQKEQDELRHLEVVRIDTRSPEQAAKSAVDQEWAEMQKGNLHLRNLP
jgi:uncharacterized protein (DUF58 family)